MKYESFSIRIDPSPGTPGGQYAVSVQSPQGEGRGTFRAPETGEPACDAGKELFRALFRDEVASLFHASLGGLRGEHGLRIDILINPRLPASAPVQKLPWELLCRPETEDCLCLSRRTPVVRSLEAHRERRSAPTPPGRLRILVVAASPTDCPPLDVARERTNLEESWKGQEKNAEIVFLEHGGVEEMRQALLQATFHIIHFMGHGEFDEERGEGALFFERRDGTSHLLDGRRLAQLLHDFESLRLVVLNACHTAEAVGRSGPNPFAGVATSLVMGGLPAVVAMNGPVSDRAAVAFSRSFYQRLAAGDSMEAAVTEGRLAIQRAEPEEEAWATPTLFLRSPDGQLFAPPSTVLARRAMLLASSLVACGLILTSASGWWREHHAAEAVRLANNGIGFLQLGKKEDARQAFLSALHSDPKNAATLDNLAVLEMQLGEEEAALAHAQEAVQADPKAAIHHYNLGNLLAHKKRYEEALPSLRRAIEIDPQYTYAYNELGNVYLELGLPAEARKAFEAGLTCDPTLAQLHKNLARTALAEGRPDEAIRHAARALPLYSPADPAGKTEALYWSAVANAAAGQEREACTALRDLKALDPRLLSPFGQKAALLAKQSGCKP